MGHSDELKRQILSLTREYALEALGEKKFVPGETYIRTSGEVFSSEEFESLVDVALGGWYTEGKFSHDFEQDLRAFLDNQIRHVILCNSGSSANLLAVSAITQPEFGEKRAKPGDEIITCAVGFPTTVSPIIQNNLVPVFVDMNFPNYAPDPVVIEHAITEKTKGIILAHTLGNPFNIEAIRDICDEYGLWMIEDSCDALGAKYDGKFVGTVGDISTVSFFPAHQITTAEGGAVFTDSPMVKKVIDSLRAWGRGCWCLPGKDNTCGKRFSHQSGALPYGYDHKYIFDRLGYNIQTTDLQSAIGIAQVKKLPGFVKTRSHNWQRLYDGLKKYEKYFILPEATENSEPSWFGFVLTLQKHVPFTRSEIVKYLEDHKVGTRMLFGGNLLRHPAFIKAPHRVFGRLDNANVITECSFWVGVYPGITDEMVDYILEIFEDFLENKRWQETIVT